MKCLTPREETPRCLHLKGGKMKLAARTANRWRLSWRPVSRVTMRHIDSCTIRATRTYSASRCEWWDCRMLPTLHSRSSCKPSVRSASSSGRSRIETWLYRLAVNESLQHLRRNRRWQHQALDREPIDTSQRIENVEGKEQLELALTRIDPELRSIFLLREVDGLSYHDIAEALQIPEGTVGSRLNRARRELKQHLLELGFEPH